MRNIYVALNLKPEKGSCCNYESSYERIQTPTEDVFSSSELKLLNIVENIWTVSDDLTVCLESPMMKYRWNIGIHVNECGRI